MLWLGMLMKWNDSLRGAPSELRLHRALSAGLASLFVKSNVHQCRYLIRRLFQTVATTEQRRGGEREGTARLKSC